MYGMRTDGYACQSECGEADYARALAHWAKVELLKEKVKQRIEAKHGKQLDKMADLIVEILEEKARGYAEMEEKHAQLKEEMQGLVGEEDE